MASHSNHSLAAIPPSSSRLPILLGYLIGALAGGYLGDRIGTAVAQTMQPVEALREFRLDVAGPTLDGKNLTLDQYKGKVVLVDFWATWCGPCLRELPGIKGLYNKYHDQGLEIIGVSLDHDRAALERFVAEQKIPWPQIWESTDPAENPNPISWRNGVSAIPMTFLLNRQGEVVARGLRSSELWRAVEQVLAEDPAGPLPLIDHRFTATGLIIGVIAGFLIGGLVGSAVSRFPRFSKGKAFRAE